MTYIIDHSLLDALSGEAAKSVRLRMNRDMRTSADDTSQRMLNALEPGTVLPVHRHRNTTETVIVLRGTIQQRYYDDSGNMTDCITLEADGDKIGISVPAGQWHDTIALKHGTVIFEAKDGAYAPLSEEDILH